LPVYEVDNSCRWRVIPGLFLNMKHKSSRTRDQLVDEIFEEGLHSNPEALLDMAKSLISDG